MQKCHDVTRNGSFDKIVKEIDDGLQEGDTTYFGNYECLVLKKEGDRALLITRDCVDKMPYRQNSSAESGVRWEGSTIRSWLNTEFISEFGENDLLRVIETNRVSGNAIVTDLFFLLTLEEAENLLTQPERISFYDENSTWWWLASRSDYGGTVAWVSINGNVEMDKKNYSEIGGIRPAMWVKH